MPLRADILSPLSVSGQTAPNADLAWRLNFTTNPALDANIKSNALGTFLLPLPVLTISLMEGSNRIYVQASKNGEYSEWRFADVVVDSVPPTISGPTPAPDESHVKTHQPFVGAILKDMPSSNCPNCVTSGVNTSVITLATANAIPIASQTERTKVLSKYSFIANDYYVIWIDSATGLPPVLKEGAGLWYYPYIEGGDNAQYKRNLSWRFKINVNNGDGSGPNVPNKYLDGVIVGHTANNQPLISCVLKDGGSGVDLSSIELFVDDMGISVLNAQSLNFAASLEPTFDGSNPLPGIQDGVKVSYKPDAPLSVGLHTVKVKAKNWADNPVWEDPLQDTWAITIDP